MAIIHSDTSHEMKGDKENPMSVKLTDKGSDTNVQVSPALAELIEQVSPTKPARRVQLAPRIGFAVGEVVAVATAAAILITPLFTPSTPQSPKNVETTRSVVQPAAGEYASTLNATRYAIKYLGQVSAPAKEVPSFNETRYQVKYLGQSPAPAKDVTALNEIRYWVTYLGQTPAPATSASPLKEAGITDAHSALALPESAYTFSETRFWHQLASPAPVPSEVANRFNETRYGHWLQNASATWMATSNHVGS